MDSDMLPALKIKKSISITLYVASVDIENLFPAS